MKLKSGDKAFWYDGTLYHKITIEDSGLLKNGTKVIFFIFDKTLQEGLSKEDKILTEEEYLISQIIK